MEHELQQDGNLPAAPQSKTHVFNQAPHVQFHCHKFFKMVSICIPNISLKYLQNVSQWDGTKIEH
jgi:hypothetical protein